MSKLIVNTQLTEEQLRDQLGMIINFAKSRYKELGKGLPCAPVSEEQFTAVYLVAHRDVMVTLGKGIAEVSKRRIYTV